MATTTTNYSFTLPEVGGDTDQWGTQLNSNWTLADTTLKTIADSVGDDVTLTGNDYLTISGQAITVGDVDLTADVTGTLPVSSGGTGLSSLGTANQVLAVNGTADGLEFQTISGSGTVTSIAVSGSDGIEIDSGSPITTSGTIALGVNATTLSTHLGLGSLATQSTITESQISDLQTYLTASSTATLTNKSGNISQWTNDSGYLTNESNDLSSAVTWADVPNANITQGAVTQHQAALSITESQISDFGSYQAADAGLTSIAGLTTAADKMLYTTDADTYAVTSLSSFARTILDDADASAVIGTLGLSSLYATSAQGALADSATQPGDLATTLNVSATDKLLGRATSGAGAVEEITLTSAGRALLDDADNSAQRTTLGLGSIATQAADAVNIEGGAIDGVTIGTNAVATDLRVDNLQLDGNTISSTDTNGDVAISPNGTGNVSLGNFTFDVDQTVGLSEDNYVLTYDHSTTSISLEAASGGSAISNVVEDLSPQLGGHLDVNGQSIQSSSGGNISITPDTTGKIILDGLSWPTADGSEDQVLKTDGYGNLSFVDQSGGAGSGSAYIEHSSTVSDSLAISSGTNRMYIGNTTFSGSGDMEGYLVVSHGYANFTSASALNIFGTLKVG